MLRLEAEAAALAVGVAGFAQLAAQVVARIELHAGLGRSDFERPPARWLDDVRRAAQPRSALQDEVVVVAGAAL